MNRKDFNTYTLPDEPGIYFFKKGKDILYVGKATSLRDRVRSYFSRDLIDTRGPFLVKMIEEATNIDYVKTHSVLEALILEAHTIKTHQPVYNTKEKDNRSYNFVVITDEEFPRVIIKRGRELSMGVSSDYQARFIAGPFPHGEQLREALKIVRKIFPFRDKCVPFNVADKSKTKTQNNIPRPCFNRQIGLCPGVCTGEVTVKQYEKTIKNIELFFSGKIEQVKKNLEKDMKLCAREKEFESAEKIKRTLFSLNHIRDVSLIKAELTPEMAHQKGLPFRIEAYDIAHISGTSTVGVMVVIEGGEIEKKEYRKFKIQGDEKGITIDDTKNLSEVLRRRLGHLSWRLPDLIVIDGGEAQVNVAKAVLSEKGFDIEIVSVVKDEKHKPKDFIGKKVTVNTWSREILLANSEAHRFAIAYHRVMRSKLYK